MNIFIRQNIGRGVITMKNFISSTFESRYWGIMEVHKDYFMLNRSRFAAML